MRPPRIPPTIVSSLSTRRCTANIVTMLSRLESLPAELLQAILLHSSNIELPLCSHIIGAKLSNEEAFREISIHYLFGFDALQETSKRKEPPSDQLLATSPQSRILSAKFMTLSRFKLYLAVAMGRTVQPCPNEPNMLVATLFDFSLRNSRAIFSKYKGGSYLRIEGRRLRPRVFSDTPLQA